MSCVLLTFDYELYFGANAGTVERCLIEPADALMAMAARAGVGLTFFVDAGMLLRMLDQAPRSAEVARQLDLVQRQLAGARSAGHDLQLHIHPHWEDSAWRDGAWRMDTRRYALRDFGRDEAAAIVRGYKAALESVSGASDVCAYRGGGMVVQPFAPVAEALLAAGLTIDSSVVPGLHIDDIAGGCDFRGAPETGPWRFDDDPLSPVPGGRFLEVPIASHWPGRGTKLGSALSKRIGAAEHAIFGDGHAMNARRVGGGARRLRRLFANAISPVWMDGYHANALGSAHRRSQAAGQECFVAIGHPKAMTRHGIAAIERFAVQVRALCRSYPELRDRFQAPRGDPLAAQPALG